MLWTPRGYGRVFGVTSVDTSGTRAVRWIHGLRYREHPVLDHSRLRWYREPTTTYRLTARCIVPAGLRALARVSVTGLDNVPSTGPVILAANHFDNLDAYLLLNLVSRQVHFAARPDAFGTGSLCAVWRRLGAFPADAWGIRYGLKLLAEGAAVGVFPQGAISKDLMTPCGAAGVLALYSGAPVVPIAIRGTDEVRLHSILTGRVSVCVRFGTPVEFPRCGASALRSRAVSDEILHHIQTLLTD
jgi:1-acyl-sn-glycerol-3-phosphate acyltransferase